MSDVPAIEVRKLYKTYRDGFIFRRPFEALKGISLEVYRGEIFGLLGPNGAGKTTLVKLLLGIVRKTQGYAMLLGRPAGDRSGRKEVGCLPENLRLPRHHTAHTRTRFVWSVERFVESRDSAASAAVAGECRSGRPRQGLGQKVLQRNVAAFGAGHCLVA